MLERLAVKLPGIQAGFPQGYSAQGLSAVNLYEAVIPTTHIDDERLRASGNREMIALHCNFLFACTQTASLRLALLSEVTLRPLVTLRQVVKEVRL